MQAWLVPLPAAGLCCMVGTTFTMVSMVLFGTTLPLPGAWTLYLGQLPESLEVHLLLSAGAQVCRTVSALVWEMSIQAPSCLSRRDPGSNAQTVLRKSLTWHLLLRGEVAHLAFPAQRTPALPACSAPSCPASSP